MRDGHSSGGASAGRHVDAHDRRLSDRPRQPRPEQDGQRLSEALKAFIAFGGDLDYVSGAGYLGSELFAFMVPLLLLIAAIGAGARAIAGEEERGTLDLLLANPSHDAGSFSTSSPRSQSRWLHSASS